MGVRPIVVPASVVIPGIGELPLALFGAWLTDSRLVDANERVELGLSGATVDTPVTPRVIPDSVVEPAKVATEMVPDSKFGLAAVVPVMELDPTIKLETNSPVWSSEPGTFNMLETPTGIAGTLDTIGITVEAIWVIADSVAINGEL